MNESLFTKLIKAKSINAIAKLVQANFKIHDADQLPHYINHLVGQYKATIKLCKADNASQSDFDYALTVAKMRACQMMGGSDEQWFFIKNGAK